MNQGYPEWKVNVVEHHLSGYRLLCFMHRHLHLIKTLPKFCEDNLKGGWTDQPHGSQQLVTATHMPASPKTTLRPGHESEGQTAELYQKHKNSIALTVTNIKVLESQFRAGVIQ